MTDMGPPLPDETPFQYVSRLERSNLDEMFIRKALLIHYRMTAAMGDFFEQLPEARLRHVAKLVQIQPGRTEYSLARRLSRNLEISQERAEFWVKRYKARAQTI